MRRADIEVPNLPVDTRNRYRQLEEAIREDRVGRVKEVQAEIDFIQNRKADCFLLYDLLDEGVLPLRVTHNDTKLKCWKG